MPEPTPTTDVVSEQKGKKLPKWALIAIIGGGVFALLYYKHIRAKQEESNQGFVEARTGGQNLEQTIPTAGGGQLAAAAAALQKQNTEFLEKSINEEQKTKEAPSSSKTQAGSWQGTKIVAHPPQKPLQYTGQQGGSWQPIPEQKPYGPIPAEQVAKMTPKEVIEKNISPKEIIR